MHPHATGTRTLSLPKYNKKSRFTRAWEPYLAANLFMYVVPLAIFLRRARELDFSPAKFDYSVQLVKRVFRVFSPEVVDVLSRLLSGETTNQLVSRHREVLGPFAPPPGPMSLASYKTDMHNLLDEIHMQHRKTMREQNSFDRVFGKLEGLFGQGVASKEEKALNSLLESARLIAQLPLDYQISTVDGMSLSSAARTLGDRAPDRASNGGLSETGRDQVFSGLVKCNPVDISFRGDKMKIERVKTHEVAFLVDFMLWLSDWLNDKLGIAPGDTNVLFRFNLRFLADYRNLLFTMVLLYVAIKLVFGP